MKSIEEYGSLEEYILDFCDFNQKNKYYKITRNGDILIKTETANFHHLYNVLRVKIGEIIEVVDIDTKTLYITEVKDRLRKFKNKRYNRKKSK